MMLDTSELLIYFDIARLAAAIDDKATASHHLSLAKTCKLSVH